MDYKAHIMQAINYIEHNLKWDVTISDCARVSGYSDYHFIRVFKEATGLTPADYIRKRRLTEIIKHMRQDTPFSEVAFEYGFNSKENFTRAFLKEHRILPTEYRSTLISLKLYEAISFDIEIFTTPKTSHYNFINTIHHTWTYINSEWLPNSRYERTGGYEFESYIEEPESLAKKYIYH